MKKTAQDITMDLLKDTSRRMNTYSYYELAFGGFVVCRNDEPIWEVETRSQAEGDVEQLEAAE